MTHLDRGYDGLAESYDAARFEGSAGEFNARRDAAIVRELAARTGVKVFCDVPTGTGRTAQYFQGMGIKVIGCDLSGDMLTIAKAKAERLSLDLQVIKADASGLPMGSNSIEGLICLRFFHLFAHRDRFAFMKEFHRVVKPGGYLICSATNAFYGVGINLLRKITGHFTITFLWPGQTGELFSGWDVVACRGNYLPLQWCMDRRWPRVESRVEGWLRRFPWDHFCFERFFLLRKRVHE